MWHSGICFFYYTPYVKWFSRYLFSVHRWVQRYPYSCALSLRTQQWSITISFSYDFDMTFTYRYKFSPNNNGTIFLVFFSIPYENCIRFWIEELLDLFNTLKYNSLHLHTPLEPIAPNILQNKKTPIRYRKKETFLVFETIIQRIHNQIIQTKTNSNRNILEVYIMSHTLHKNSRETNHITRETIEIKIRAICRYTIKIYKNKPMFVIDVRIAEKNHRINRL